MVVLAVVLGFGSTGCDSGGDSSSDAATQDEQEEDGTATPTEDLTSPEDLQNGDTVSPDDNAEPVECSADAECTGKVEVGPCKVAKCTSGVCEAANVADGTACDDGNTCSTGDACTAGVCAGEAYAGCCGNDACEATENCETCPDDCGGCLTCQEILTCSMDCVSMECGEACIAKGSTESAGLFEALHECIKNSDCSPSDNPCIATNCSVEAEACNSAAVCGNTVCELGEDATSCPQDCATTSECGDGTCDQGEDAETCPLDCSGAEGSCAGYCGSNPPDGSCYCDSGCADYGDCCSDFASVCNSCGDGACLGSETCTSCEQDCGACPVCGNGTCDDGEDCTSCEGDCGACAAQTCVGFCGGQSEAGCYCDDLCAENNDCCPDYATACPAQ